ncbi:MAG: hypothetical protein PHF31_13285 [Methylobacter sp.]|nr:hypothetical protein [Methylobacter sp.]
MDKTDIGWLTTAWADILLHAIAKSTYGLANAQIIDQVDFIRASQFSKSKRSI